MPIQQPSTAEIKNHSYIALWTGYLAGKLVKDYGLAEDVAIREIFLSEFYQKLCDERTDYITMRLVDQYEILTTELTVKQVLPIRQ
jgi:hypothetical protein